MHFRSERCIFPPIEEVSGPLGEELDRRRTQRASSGQRFSDAFLLGLADNAASKPERKPSKQQAFTTRGLPRLQLAGKLGRDATIWATLGERPRAPEQKPLPQD